MTEQLIDKNSLQGLLSPLGADPCQGSGGPLFVVLLPNWAGGLKSQTSGALN